METSDELTKFLARRLITYRERLVVCEAASVSHKIFVKRRHCLLPKHPPPVLLAHFVGDARPRQAHEFGEWRVRSARSARQRRNEACHRRVGVTVERAQVDR